MNTTIDALDRLKSRYNLPSDYATAKLLQVTKAAISKYRNNRSQFDDAVANRAAKLLEIDPTTFIASLHKERATSQDELEAWEAIEKKCNLVQDLKKQQVIEAMKAAAAGKVSKKQQAIFEAISEQCILCKIGNYGESDTFGPLS